MTPPSIRFGIGLCYYRLGNINKATFAFQRVIELDPQNSMAKVALAVVEMAQRQSDDQTLFNIYSLLEQAYLSNRDNPLVYRYLADEFFRKKQFNIAQQYCDQGLQVMEMFKRSEVTIKENPNFRKEMEFLKSDFFFILGKI